MKLKEIEQIQNMLKDRTKTIEKVKHLSNHETHLEIRKGEGFVCDLYGEEKALLITHLRQRVIKIEDAIVEMGIDPEGDFGIYDKYRPQPEPPQPAVKSKSK